MHVGSRPLRLCVLGVGLPCSCAGCIPGYNVMRAARQSFLSREHRPDGFADCQHQWDEWCRARQDAGPGEDIFALQPRPLPGRRKRTHMRWLAASRCRFPQPARWHVRPGVRSFCPSPALALGRPVSAGGRRNLCCGGHHLQVAVSEWGLFMLAAAHKHQVRGQDWGA